MAWRKTSEHQATMRTGVVPGCTGLSCLSSRPGSCSWQCETSDEGSCWGSWLEAGGWGLEAADRLTGGSTNLMLVV
jgi:hypothetical protein